MTAETGDDQGGGIAGAGWQFTQEVCSGLLVLDGVTEDIVDEYLRQPRDFAALGEGSMEFPKGARLERQISEWGKAVQLFVDGFRFLAILRHWALADQFIRAVNEGRVFGVALAARASLETSAALVYHYKEIIAATEALVTQQHNHSAFQEAISKSILGSRFDWQRDARGRDALLGEYAESIKGAEVRGATNILTMMEDLRTDLEERAPGSAGLVGHAYAKLSDVCHPSFGGYGVFGLDGEESILLSGKIGRVHAVVTAAQSIPTLVLAGGASLDRLGRLARFSEGFAH